MVQSFKKTIILLCVLIFGVIVVPLVFAQESPTPSSTDTPTPTPDNSAQISDLQKQIQDLQNKISNLQGQEHTLSSQIELMDSQIQKTELQIKATQQSILVLGSEIGIATKKIATLESSVADLTRVLLSRIVATYEIETIQPMQVLFTSNTAGDFLVRANYLRIMQAHDKRLAFDTIQAKNDYANQKAIFVDKKQKVEALKSQLESYNQELTNEQDAKKSLLTQTQGSEANYQKLLAQAQAQLAGFSGFAASQGGASLISNQTVCDDWGCYYNQRDSQWGGLALNHTQYSIASDGCLLTSVAMVYTHYGHKNVNPISVNVNSSNFASYYPAYLLYSVVAEGISSQRSGVGSTISAIDSIINDSNHDPAIVGIKYANGDTHFVVIISGASGNYTMNDPFVPNGHGISFTDHYSLGSIFEVDRVSM